VSPWKEAEDAAKKKKEGEAGAYTGSLFSST